MGVLMEARGLTKSFSGAPALVDGELSIDEGEIHALVGANGAGKSTLLKAITGVHHPDSGTILLSNEEGNLEEVTIPTPRRASELGIAIVHQELVLAENLTVSDNISLGNEPMRNWGLTLDRRRANEHARKALALLDSDIDPRATVASLSNANKQLVEIAKNLAKRARLLILDEPTTSLTDNEADELFQVLRRLRGQGMGIVYVSHRMEEIYKLTDRITVMRDGRYVETIATKDANRPDLVRSMIGRSLAEEMSREHRVETDEGAVSLEIDNVSSDSGLSGVTLAVREGEIVGLFGLVGAGRTELARVAFGIDPARDGQIRVMGETIRNPKPSKSIEAGVAFLPEDRKHEGLILGLPIRENIGLAALSQSGPILLTSALEDSIWNRFQDKLGIRAQGANQTVGSLSGGNQQKVALAKWLALNPSILILDEPTRGVDVGAKQDIYDTIRELAAQGVAILLISSEMEEIQLLSDRIAVLREGELVFDKPNIDLDSRTILAAAMWGTQNE